MNKRSITNTDKNKYLFCDNSLSRSLPNMGKVLVTGASGYVGGKLVPELIARGYKVRIMAMETSPVYKSMWPEVEVAVANALNQEQLKAALDGIDTAYYLIHSLRLGPRGFKVADIRAASNFRKAAEEKHVKRIIYLGGLGDVRSSLSSHLRNRIAVAQELKKGRVAVTVLRAAVIIGSGSASYEIIQHLVKAVPILAIPRWAKTKCQPIAICDVIKYLVGVLEISETSGKSFDIGGRDILTYEMMLKTLASLLNKKMLFVPFPFSNIRFYAYCASILTPVPNPIIRCLMEGLKNDVICLDKSIKSFLPFEPVSYRDALVKAMSCGEQNREKTI
ncbi:MAG: NAD(P)H-binding protein [Candidatus Scalinduaceae bacterium]